MSCIKTIWLVPGLLFIYTVFSLYVPDTDMSVIIVALGGMVMNICELMHPVFRHNCIDLSVFNV